MKRVSAKEVENELVIGQAGLSPYKKSLGKISKLSKKEKLKLSKQEAFKDTWTELFEDSKTKWYKAELPPTADFVNKIFDSGRGFMTHIGLTHRELLNDYITRRMPAEHKKIIDEIRKKLSVHPIIIVLTKDFKEFSIFDGARRALAFMLEKKKIPVYIGKRKSFPALKYLR